MKSRIFLIALSMLVFGSVCNAQEPPNSNAPLSTDDLREGIIRIEQGILAGKEADLLRRTMVDRDALADRERAIAARELETEKMRTELERQQVEVEKTRGDFYENAFRTVTKKTSALCHIAKVFTLGLAKCGR